MGGILSRKKTSLHKKAQKTLEDLKKEEAYFSGIYEDLGFAIINKKRFKELNKIQQDQFVDHFLEKIETFHPEDDKKIKDPEVFSPLFQEKKALSF
jgi:hypothetical protein